MADEFPCVYFHFVLLFSLKRNCTQASYSMRHTSATRRFLYIFILFCVEESAIECATSLISLPTHWAVMHTSLNSRFASFLFHCIVFRLAICVKGKKKIARQNWPISCSRISPAMVLNFEKRIQRMHKTKLIINGIFNCSCRIWPRALLLVNLCVFYGYFRALFSTHRYSNE